MHSHVGYHIWDRTMTDRTDLQARYNHKMDDQLTSRRGQQHGRLRALGARDDSFEAQSPPVTSQVPPRPGAARHPTGDRSHREARGSRGAGHQVDPASRGQSRGSCLTGQASNQALTTNNNNSGGGSGSTVGGASCLSGMSIPLTCQQETDHLLLGPDQIDMLLALAVSNCSGTEMVGCCKLALQSSHVGNIIRNYLVAVKYGLYDVMDQMIHLIRRNFLCISRSLEFLSLPLEYFLMFMEDSYLNVQNEMDMFVTALMWIDFNKQERICSSGRVLKCVRYAYINPTDIVQYVEPNLHLFTGPDGSEALINLYKHHVFTQSRLSLPGDACKIPPKRGLPGMPARTYVVSGSSSASGRLPAYRTQPGVMPTMSDTAPSAGKSQRGRVSFALKDTSTVIPPAPQETTVSGTSAAGSAQMAPAAGSTQPGTIASTPAADDTQLTAQPKTPAADGTQQLTAQPNTPAAGGTQQLTAQPNTPAAGGTQQLTAPASTPTASGTQQPETAAIPTEATPQKGADNVNTDASNNSSTRLYPELYSSGWRWPDPAHTGHRPVNSNTYQPLCLGEPRGFSHIPDEQCMLDCGRLSQSCPVPGTVRLASAGPTHRQGSEIPAVRSETPSLRDAKNPGQMCFGKQSPRQQHTFMITRTITGPVVNVAYPPV